MIVFEWILFPPYFRHLLNPLIRNRILRISLPEPCGPLSHTPGRFRIRPTPWRRVKILRTAAGS